MPSRQIRAIARAGLLIALAAAAWADEKLSAAYSAILRGDYDAGRAALTQLRDSGAPAEQVSQVEVWLKSYQEMNARRDEMRGKTYDWKVENAKVALAEADTLADPSKSPALSAEKRALEVARKTYLALSFASQASLYCSDQAAFAQEAWVQTLRQKAMAVGGDLATQQKWTK